MIFHPGEISCILHLHCTVNPLLSPIPPLARGAYLFQTHLRGA